MIAKITGLVAHVYKESLIVENAGLGYQIICLNSVLNRAVIGQPISLFLASQIKDQQHVVYFGFETYEEKTCFFMIQSVSGVGSKMAISILSNLTLDNLSIAIKSEDKNLLTSIPGVGKKLAERIVLELKNKVESFLPKSSTYPGNGEKSLMIDATSALCQLGMNYNEAFDRVKKAQGQLADSELSIENLIRISLK